MNIDSLIYSIRVGLHRGKDEEVESLSGVVNGQFRLVCLHLVFSVNHIQYGLINLIWGQLCSPLLLLSQVF